MLSHTVISIILSCILTFLLLPNVKSEEDLYGTLGVDSSASLKTIKQAYKKLAKVWHPDKNRNPAANERFMKINEAYETLSDPRKRENYDRFGMSSGQANSQQGFDGFDHSGPFEHFFHEGAFGGSKSNNRINLWTYEKEIYPNSIKKPFFVYAYVNFCLQCVRVWPIWEQFAKDLEKLGLGIGTLDVNSDPMLRQRLKVRSIPSVVVVIDRRIVHFTSASFNARSLRDFLRSVHPPSLVPELQEHLLGDFLSDFWSGNKVKVVMFDSRKHACLRFLSSAFAARNNAQAAHLNVKKLAADSPLWKRYSLTEDGETIVLIKEDNSSSILSSPSITRSQMDGVMDELLVVPRINSQAIFQRICPLKKHCILLLLWNRHENDLLNSFVQSASSLPAHAFAYVTTDLQPALVAALSKDTGPSHNDSSHRRKLMAIWRKSEKQWKYEMMEGGWGVERGGELAGWVGALVGRGARMDSTLVFKGVPIVDETAESLFEMLGRKWSEYTDVDLLGVLETFDSPFSTLIIASAILFSVFFVIKNSFAESSSSSSSSSPPPSEHPTHPSILEQLDSASYDRLVLGAQSGGWRLVLLLLDAEWSLPQKKKCIKSFLASVKPYSSSHFRFRFMYLNLTTQRLRWCRKVFPEAFKRDHPTTTTVLAFNPTLKYYHFLASSSSSPSPSSSPPSEGHFLDLGDEEDEQEPSMVGAWMDRLYEGACPKYPVTAWPEQFN